MSLISSSLPVWLCEKTLQKIVESKLNKSCQVLSVDSSKGSTAGDHYLSEIVRLTVKVKDGSNEQMIPLIVKDVSGGWNDFMDEVNAVNKEVEVYSELVAYANRVLEEPVTADCYFVSSNNCLLLEDLSNLGYRLADRRKQLDYDHCVAALRSLAQFHAVSVKLLEIAPNSFKISGEETAFVPNKNTIMYNLYKHCSETAIRSLKNHAEGREYVDSLNSFLTTFWEDSRKAMVGDSDFKVLNHGDYWLTNILFKYHNGKVQHCRLVDFQLTRYATPCYDLHLFIATSVRADVIDKHMDDLLNEYIISLNKTLTKLGSSQSFSKANLDKALDQTKVFGILNVLSLAAVVLNDPDQPLQLSELTKEEVCGGFKNLDPYKDTFNDEVYLKHTVSILKYYRKQRYL